MTGYLHTPGPWKVLLDEYSSVVRIGPLCADVTADDHIGVMPYIDADHHDVTLASAAPELLGACRLANVLIADLMVYEKDEAVHKLMLDAALALGGAIDKATAVSA